MALSGSTISQTNRLVAAIIQVDHTQGKIERWHRTLKNRLPGNHYLPGDLEQQIDAFVEHYNHRRYQESLNNLTPASVYTRTGQAITSDNASSARPSRNVA